jgi:hypothetical protein
LQHAQLHCSSPLHKLASKIGEVVEQNKNDGAGLRTGPLMGMLIGVPVSLGLWMVGGGLVLLALH